MNRLSEESIKSTISNNNKEKITFHHWNKVNRVFSVGAVKLTKNANFDKYSYSGYGIRFDWFSSLSDGSGYVKNVIIYGIDNSSTVHIDNIKMILILGKGPTDVLDQT